MVKGFCPWWLGAGVGGPCQRAWQSRATMLCWRQERVLARQEAWPSYHSSRKTLRGPRPWCCWWLSVGNRNPWPGSSRRLCVWVGMPRISGSRCWSEQIHLCRWPWVGSLRAIGDHGGWPWGPRRLSIGVWIGTRDSRGLGVGVTHWSGRSRWLGIGVLRCGPCHGPGLRKSPGGVDKGLGHHCSVWGMRGLAIRVTGLWVGEVIDRPGSQRGPVIGVHWKASGYLSHWPIRILGGQRRL